MVGGGVIAPSERSMVIDGALGDDGAELEPEVEKKGG